MGIAILLYFIASIIFTYPLILRLGNFLPGQPNDAYVYLWNIWNFWHQILSGNNPFFTNFVMYPIGANLFFHTYAPLISTIAFPFLKYLSLFMGISIIIAILLSSLSAYLLGYKLTHNKTASFVGGLFYGLSPIMHSFMQSQHYYFLFSSVFYPLGIYLLLIFFNSKKIKYLYGVICLFWLVLLTDYYSAVLYSLLVSIFFILNEELNIQKSIKYFKVGLISLIIPFILFYSFGKDFRQFINYKQQVNSSSSCNTNILGFVTPNIVNPIIGMPQNINLDTPSYFLGWGILIIAIVSAIKYRKNKYINSFTILFILFFLLSLGTNIKLGNKILFEGPTTLFYYFLKIPILSAIDCPIRFPIILQLCISVSIAFFVANHKKLTKITIALFLLLIIEYGVTNKDFSSTQLPTVYKYLSNQSDYKTVLEIPSGISESKSAFGYDWSIQALHSQQMYWQTFYQKPRVGVYMSRLTRDKYEFFKSEPIISDIFNFSSANGERPKNNIDDQKIYEFIKKFNLGYIILSPNPRQINFKEFVESEFKNYIIEKKEIEGFIYYKLL